MSYVDYAGGVEDVLAMCLTGFPSFDQKTAQRRSLIYVGPGSRRAPGETRPALFTADAVRDLARTADVQVNVVITGSGSDALDAAGPRHRRPLVLGKREHHRSRLRDQEPPAAAGGRRGRRRPCSPKRRTSHCILALAALAGLVLWPLVVRR